MYKTRATTTFVLPGILFSVTLLLSACAATPENGSAETAVSDTSETQAAARESRNALERRSSAEAEAEPEIRESAPERYVVKKGDTLWDISAMFLQDPWYWPEIWLVQPFFWLDRRPRCRQGCRLASTTRPRAPTSRSPTVSTSCEPVAA